jgi:hypothetical protein
MSDALSLEEFGKQILQASDLDPIYTMLANSNLSKSQKRRWCAAYWCFYHAGAASYLSEQNDFWPAMLTAGLNEKPTPINTRWPRSAERRHFRGVACIKALTCLAARFPQPEWMAETFERQAPSFHKVRDRVMEQPLFGPWIAFKIADMLDRVLNTHVDFSEADVFMFDSPTEAAVMWYDGDHEGGYGVAHGIKIQMALGHLNRELTSFTAPPFNDRPLGLQEFETVLCKWKSHVNGHYPIGKDTHEIREGLQAWAGASPTAAHLMDSFPVLSAENQHATH